MREAKPATDMFATGMPGTVRNGAEGDGEACDSP
jgi:hypothetical protein